MIVTSQQMKQIELAACESGLTMERLMENAGSAAARAICRLADVEGQCVTIFCGKGNNGGDGYVVARLLMQSGADVVIVRTDGEPSTPQASAMLERLKPMEIPILDFGQDMAFLTQRLSATSILVDAIYGTGFHGGMDDAHRQICRLMCGVGARIFSLDIPSGLNANTGAADEYAIRAEATLVFDCHKPATVMPKAAAFCGSAVLCDIGIPPQAHDGVSELYTLMDAAHVFGQIPARRRETHKGDYGRLLNVAGCAAYMGAAALSTMAALRTGAGYVTLASTKDCCAAAFSSAMEAVMKPLAAVPDGFLSRENIPALLETLKTSSALLIGNGLGCCDDTLEILKAMLKAAKCPVIIDADGINLIAPHIDILREVSCPVILTPHPREFSRLCAALPEQKCAGALQTGLAFAAAYHVTLVLKDAHTHTVTADGHVYINTTGNAGMAKAGSGDVLAGIIASLAAQGLEPDAAASCGVWLHGCAGDSAAEIFSQAGMLARDIVSSLPHVFLENKR